MPLPTLLVLLLVILLVLSLPRWGGWYAGYGYYPTGGIGLVLVIVIILLLFRVI